MISPEEANLLISRYRSDQPLLRINLILRDMSVSMRLTARAVPKEPPGQLTMFADNGDHCLVVLRDCCFEYGDAREVEDPEIRAASEAKFAGCLTVLFPAPSNERLYILELR
jgi:hypothetical protein